MESNASTTGGGGGGGVPSLYSRRNAHKHRSASASAPHTSSPADSVKKDGRLSEPVRRTSLSNSSSAASTERSVKRLRLSKALTIPEGTTVLDAARRMSARRVDAALLTDSSALLCGIITDKDIATRVIAEGLKPAETFVSKIMTKNPVFVMADTSAVDALTKMVQGKFRHLPVVENGEVIALLDIAKCLYDTIVRMERAAEKGNAIVAAVEGVEREWGSNSSGRLSDHFLKEEQSFFPMTFIETLRERMFRPSIANVVADNPVVAKVSPTDSVYIATKKMRDLGVNAAMVTVDNKPRGILTPKDILMRVVAHFLSSESTTVEKIMTSNPECVTIDTPIVDALHIMHDGKFLHLPVVDRDGYVVACIDVLQITHAAIAMVGNFGVNNDGVSTLMQKFWDSAMALDPSEDHDDLHSDVSAKFISDASEAGRSLHASLAQDNTFGFKLEDNKGRIHRFNCGTENLNELLTAIMQRVGDIDPNNMPQLLYEDDEGDKVLLATDSDLVAAVNYARLAGLKQLRIHLDYTNLPVPKKEREITRSEFPEASISADMDVAHKNRWHSTYATAAAGVALIAGVSVMAFLKKSAD
eukprot:TRINITY_DN15888_c0_g5_i1.p1 TRINITY_DN15888_c0_g5~~TRINITY_DN15888_c0_g5_i1.p1  ORF type:complete len:586 (+),score=121.68 TRINITY_DN15888_c0_g5_i1:372-2129(+)